MLEKHVQVGGRTYALAVPPHSLTSAFAAVRLRLPQEYWFDRHVKKFKVCEIATLGLVGGVVDLVSAFRWLVDLVG